MLAELLGLVGFILCGSRAPGSEGRGGRALVLAAFTKQTAGGLPHRRGPGRASRRGGGGGRWRSSAAGSARSRWSSRGSRSRSSRTSPGRCVGEAATPRDLRRVARPARAARDRVGRPPPAPGRSGSSSGPAAGIATRGSRRWRRRLMVVALVTSMKRGADVELLPRPPRPRGDGRRGALGRLAARGRRRGGRLRAGRRARRGRGGGRPSRCWSSRSSRPDRPPGRLLDGPTGRAVRGCDTATRVRIAADPVGPDAHRLGVHRPPRQGPRRLRRPLALPDARRHRPDRPPGPVGRIDSGYYETVITTSTTSACPSTSRTRSACRWPWSSRSAGRYELAGAGDGLFLYRRTRAAGVAGRAERP